MQAGIVYGRGVASTLVGEKTNRVPAAPDPIEALGLKGCVFPLDAERTQKNPSGASSPRAPITQAMENQPSLRRRLELGTAG